MDKQKALIMNKLKKKSEVRVIGAITTLSHFQLVICMVDSFLAHHPNSKVFILQVGGTKKLSVPNRPQVTIITERELNLSQYEIMRRQYNNFELCNALKPFLLQYIFEHTNFEKVCYFDSDIFIYENLDEEIWQKLDKYSVMLTPHLTQVSTEYSYWQDLEILRRGVFNGGFIGLRRDENSFKFLKWWGSRLIYGGFYRLNESLNCDQGWLDLVSNFDINLHINRHPGINAAFWNLDERIIEFKDEKVLINGKPLLFFHFSGYSPKSRQMLSRNSFTITFEKYPDIRPLFESYGDKLVAVGKEFEGFLFKQTSPNVSEAVADKEFEFPVSVVIPCYNSAKYINQAVSSVLSQTLRPLEIIVVDDGSTDETPEILASFGNSIKIIRQTNSGVSAARNKGIEAARGEFISFLDADDFFLDPAKLEEQLAISRQTESDIVQSGWTIVNQMGDIIVNVEEWKISPVLDLENWLKVQSILPSALLIRRSALIAVEKFDPQLNYAEDVDLMLRLLSSGYKIEWLKKSAVAYRQHENNATNNLSQRIAPAEKVWNKFFSQSNLPPGVKRLENLLRNSLYLYLAFECIQVGDFALMKKLLLESCKFSKYKSIGALLYWLDYFKNRAEIYQIKEFNVFSLISSAEWLELTYILSGTKPNLNYKRNNSNAFQTTLEKQNFQSSTLKKIGQDFFKKSAQKNPFTRKINLKPTFGNALGTHRSGWEYALNCLMPLHTKNGIYVEGAIEIQFGREKKDYLKKYQKGWIGFFHHPPDMPHFYLRNLVPEIVLQTPEMQEALKTCYGVFCFSENHRQWLSNVLTVPVERVFHPTETPDIKFTPEKFFTNPHQRIVQIGHWLRKVHSIYFLSTNLKRIIVHQDFPHVRDYFKIEKEAFGLQVDESSVEKLPFLKNDDYDELLSENIVYLELHAAAVNNAIIECIVRNTPVLVNPLPAVIEYLGKDYPFYFSSREEASRKSQNLSLIERTYEYLVKHQIKEKLTAEYFLKSIAESEIYKGLPLPKN